MLYSDFVFFDRFSGLKAFLGDVVMLVAGDKRQTEDTARTQGGGFWVSCERFYGLTRPVSFSFDRSNVPFVDQFYGLL